MITRVVPSIKGQGESAGYEVTGFQGRVRPPEDILRQARATSITGVLGQIASVASYALDILQELKNETTEVQDRMTKLHQRVDVIAEVVDFDENGKDDRPDAIIAAYERCEGVPQLELVS
eukprot:jgi/Phyca11/72326/gw1.25.541.1